MKSSLVIGIVVFFLVIIIVGWVAYMPKTQPSIVVPTSTSSATSSAMDTVVNVPPEGKTLPDNNTPPAAPSGKKETFIGTIVCLPHKDTTGPQTLECAYGLRDATGTYYGLRDTDPNYKNISNAPMDTQVKVSGVLTRQQDSKYQSVGVIAVTRITVVQ